MADRPTPFTDPWMAAEATRWAARFTTPDRALAAAREALTTFGLLPGFHTGLARFEAAVRAHAAHHATLPATVWVRQEGEMPGSGTYATEAAARHHSAAAYAEQTDTDQALLTWHHNGVHLELHDEDGEPTDWTLHEQPVLTAEQEA
ncbi:hypothetical protein [Kitasatospora cineracea]|uniref:Uncharacterized protein n=1 Tax=Kitasatospora cineracea TaxID=88074 RepID=A0A3N4RK11_9ACTN|nr:hypothetical protein [Kitasatospora cineracea]RPE27238.1 hypothetical protein EDD38_7382 [Kitasatospora cineracea]RPE27370.1 hypothetical protein EDD38_7515 [Kitasatospora cineracea]